MTQRDVQFGRVQVLQDRPLAENEELLLTLFSILDPARPRRSPPLAERVGMVRWREVAHRPGEEAPVEFRHELAETVTLPGLSSAVALLPGQDQVRVALMVETELFSFQLTVSAPPTMEGLPEGFEVTLQRDTFQVGASAGSLSQQKGKLNRDWDMVRQEVGTRVAAKVVLGFDPP